MPTPAPYIPPTDSGLDGWITNFAALITADPGLYGLEPSDAVAIQSAADLFDASFQIAGTVGLVPVSPGTKTRVTTAALNAQRAASLSVVRPYAIDIRNNLGVTNEDKADLGLTIPDPTPTPIPTPSTVPVLSLTFATPLQHTLRFSDQNTPDSRAKPFGAIACQVFRKIGVAVETDPDACFYLANFTKQPAVSTFESGDRGKIATYFARWITRGSHQGDSAPIPGPWSDPVSMYVV